MKPQNGFLAKIESLMKKIPIVSRLNLRPKKTSGYAYTNTRVRVMKTKLFSRNDYEKMLKMSFPEIARFLQETDYNKEISALAPKYSEANLLEYGLNKNLENTFKKILAFSINASEDQLRLYLKKFDVANIKTFLRGKKSGQSNEVILSELVCAGELGREFFENALNKAKNFEEAVYQLKDTEYFEVIDKFKENLSKMEDELDKYFYRTLILNAEPELENFLRDEIKAKNALNKLRAKKGEIKMDVIENESDAKFALPEKDESVENRLFAKKFLLERGKKMAQQFKRNFRPVLGYLISKENEISNIRMIVRGKSAGIPLEQLEQHLVI